MLDLSRMRHSCYRLQWQVEDFDWEAPGAEQVSEEQARALSPFLADLYWIERVAAVVFGAMEGRTTDSTLKSIFASFAVDEQRHADAELELMVRWKMLPRGQYPDANVNVRLLLKQLEHAAQRVHPSVFAAIVPMTELILDGALVRYLTTAVTDPLCHRVFEKINADEARHLAVDFDLLARYGKARSPLLNTADLGLSFADLRAVYAMFLGYVPLVSRARGNIVRAGLDLEEIRKCLARYVALGEDNADIARHPSYLFIRAYAQRLVDGKFGLGDFLVRASDLMERSGVPLA